MPPETERTRQWIGNVVMGLGLCPFVRPIFHTGQIHYYLSTATTTAMLLHDLESELTALNTLARAVRETTVLIHPHVLGEFLEYNDFLDEADAMLHQLGLQAEIQVVGFHPRHQFADATPEQIDNYTNRSPFPMLHLLRQASIDAVRVSDRDIAGIPGRNMTTLQQLAPEAQQRLRDFRF